MGKAQFQLAFDGPALRNGTMDVNELASSLLAVGELFREANDELNETRAEISVLVKSDFKRGSFEISLLVDQSLLEHAKSLLVPGAATLTGMALVRILFGSESEKKGVSGIVESVLDLWKKIKGEKPKAVIEDKEKGISIVVTGNDNQIIVTPHAAALYARDDIRDAISRTVKPVARKGIKVVEIRKGKKLLNQVLKADLPLIEEIADSSSRSSADILRDSREAVVRIVRANFDKGKWGFSDGNASFSADITDQEFKQRLDAHEVGFYKGDTLRVILTTIQVVAKGEAPSPTAYEIEKVIDHIHAPKQQGLLPPE